MKKGSDFESEGINNYIASLEKEDAKFDLVNITLTLWNSKFLIAAITALVIGASVLYALSKPNIFQSEALLAPVDSASNGALSSLVNRFGSFAGFPFRGRSSDRETTNALATLKSRAFIANFIKKYNLNVPLFARKWDPVSKEMMVDPEVYDEKNKNWLRKVEHPFTPEPSEWEGYELFTKMMNVSENPDSGLISLSIRWNNPEEAKQWVDWLVLEINEYVKQKELEEAKRSLSFLQRQLAKTSLVEMQEVLYQLIEAQTKNQMIAEIRDEYVFKTIDPAVVPKERHSPKRRNIVLAGAIIGFFIAIGTVLLIQAFRERIKSLESKT
ncbi:MAG: Wzz/FepE/Etk N-terminal domain-containing protein [Pseudomonadales bacterium]|nr:Wzz/FepE/Etk N-terminal domain-containing protein [Pseudomonadales bacterium]